MRPGPLAAAALAALVGCGDDAPGAAAASRARVERDGAILVDVEVDLAVTAAERSAGLRGRSRLLPSEGLVILQPIEGETCLVNDGVPFPIDAVYARDDGLVVAIETLAADDPTPFCHRPTRSVLEVVAGTADAVLPGDVLVVEP